MRDPEDGAAFAAAIEMICAVFRVEPTKALLTGYWLALKDMDMKGLQSAALAGIKTCEFMPTPAKLRELRPMPKFDPTERKRII